MDGGEGRPAGFQQGVPRLRSRQGRSVMQPGRAGQAEGGHTALCAIHGWNDGGQILNAGVAMRRAQKLFLFASVRIILSSASVRSDTARQSLVFSSSRSFILRA